jgi:hypothetical protein
MHTLLNSGSDVWEVGYWTPGDVESSWIVVARLDAAEDAAHLVSYLNGGPGNAKLAALQIAGKIRFG